MAAAPIFFIILYKYCIKNPNRFFFFFEKMRGELPPTTTGYAGASSIFCFCFDDGKQKNGKTFFFYE